MKKLILTLGLAVSLNASAAIGPAKLESNSSLIGDLIAKLTQRLEVDKKEWLHNTVTNIRKAAGPEYDKIRIVLAEDEMFNAFATIHPKYGYIVVITTGVLEYVNSEAELAHIVAHEIAHHALGHVPHKDFGILNNADPKHMEKMADQLGHYWTVKAGYNPHAASRMWERRIKDTGDHMHSETHPSESQRAEYLKMIR